MRKFLKASLVNRNKQQHWMGDLSQTDQGTVYN